jgi:hypothetical protein
VPFGGITNNSGVISVLKLECSFGQFYGLIESRDKIQFRVWCLLLSNKPTFLAFHQAVVAGFYAFELRFKVFLEYLLVCFQQSTTRHFRH